MGCNALQLPARRQPSRNPTEMRSISEPVSLGNWYQSIAPFVHRPAGGRHVAYLPPDHVSSLGEVGPAG